MEQTIEFKVRMDKDSEPVNVKMEVSFDGVDHELILKHATANMVVAWQSQIRNNWTEFREKGIPKVVTFGVPLFNKSRVTARKPTEQEVENHLASLIGKLSQDGLVYLATNGQIPPKDAPEFWAN